MPHKQIISGRWTGQWFGQVKRQGTRIRKVFATKQDAIAWEVEARRQGRSPEPPRSAVMASVIEWADAYLEYAVRYSPKTFSEKKRVMQRLIDAVGGETAVQAITPGMALAHLQRRIVSIIWGTVKMCSKRLRG